MSGLFYVSYALLWALVVFETLVLLGVTRLVHRGSGAAAEDAPVQASGALIGHPVPAFDASDVDGESVNRESLPPKLSAFLFVTPDCITCMASLEEIAELRARVDGQLVVVCRSGAEECRRLRDAYGLHDLRVIVDSDRRVSEAFDVYGTPTAVMIGANGTIRTYGHPMSGDDFGRLLSQSPSPPAVLQSR